MNEIKETCNFFKSNRVRIGYCPIQAIGNYVDRKQKMLLPDKVIFSYRK